MTTTVTVRTTLDENRAQALLDRGGFFTRAGLALRAALALARNPSDTEQVFVLARALDHGTLPRIRRKLDRSEEGRLLLRERPAIDTRNVDFAALRALPEHTLGGAYARMLERNALDPDLFGRPALPDPELSYVAQRIRQTHDLWHVLTGLATDVPGEVALQAFTDAQLHQRFSRLIAIGGVLLYGLRYPRMWRLTRSWYRIGQRVPFLLAVRWEALWQEPLPDVRARLGLVAAERA
ncbi:MAG: Coq4 family protein [Polyangiales bacterium]